MNLKRRSEIASEIASEIENGTVLGVLGDTSATSEDEVTFKEYIGFYGVKPTVDTMGVHKISNKIRQIGLPKTKAATEVASEVASGSIWERV